MVGDAVACILIDFQHGPRSLLALGAAASVVRAKGMVFSALHTYHIRWMVSEGGKSLLYNQGSLFYLPWTFFSYLT